MKNLQSRWIIAAVLTLSACAMAQETDAGKTMKSEVSKARCAYTPTEPGCSQATGPGADGTVLAQLPRRIGPMGPVRMGRPMGYPGYGPGWGSVPNGRHAAIGAVIGFTLGVIAGSRTSARSAVIAGTVCGGIGALFGSLVPGWPTRTRYHWPEDDEDAQMRASRSVSGGE